MCEISESRKAVPLIYQGTAWDSLDDEDVAGNNLPFHGIVRLQRTRSLVAVWRRFSSRSGPHEHSCYRYCQHIDLEMIEEGANLS